MCLLDNVEMVRRRPMETVYPLPSFDILCVYLNILKPASTSPPLPRPVLDLLPFPTATRCHPALTQGQSSSPLKALAKRRTDEEIADQDLSKPNSSDEDISGAEARGVVHGDSPDSVTTSHPTDSSTVNTASREHASNPVPRLYGSGNLHPGSYYRYRIRSFRNEPYLRKRHAPKTTSALDRLLDVWRKYVRSTCS